MILAVDVHYRGGQAAAAGVGFQHWEDGAPTGEWVVTLAEVAEYTPGQFYLRELPCILALLDSLESLPDTIVLDGHVYLDAERRPGLGKHLYDALEGRTAVIGVAKSRFRDTPADTALYRGGSSRPLYVTAVGIPAADARAFIARMHGAHRLPTLLKRVDHLSRGWAADLSDDAED